MAGNIDSVESSKQETSASNKAMNDEKGNDANAAADDDDDDNAAKNEAEDAVAIRTNGQPDNAAEKDINAASPNNDAHEAPIINPEETWPRSSCSLAAAANQPPHSITQIPKVIIPPGQTSHTEACPLIGPGWLQQAVHRTTPSGGTYKNDRIFISPDGRRFKSYIEVLKFISNTAGAGSASGGQYLAIDTKNIHSNISNSNASSTNPSPRPPPPISGPGSGKGIDVHPYQRGSVIEVLYVKRTKVFKDLNDSLLYDNDDDDSNFGGRMRRRHFWWEDEGSLSDWFNNDDDDDGGGGGGDNNNDNNNDDENGTNYNANFFDLNNTDGKSNEDSDINNDDTNNDNVWLCDIIDRAPLYPHLDNQHPQQQWKYYIHYRDFNRRMDEWIPVERIVSPPSVGNAKVRAFKRKMDEEKKERVRTEMMRERLEREEGERRMRRLLSDGGGGGGGGGGGASVGKSDVSTGMRRESSLRSSRSSSVGEAMNLLDGSTTGISNSFGVGTGLIVGGGGGGGTGSVGDCRKRQFRRSISSAIVNDASSAEFDASRPMRRRRGTGADGDLGNDVGTVSGEFASKATSSSHSAVAVAEEHTAVDVVTTLTAQILDEHEGMDEAALKEHEEVTKVKNVAMIELGKYQMDTWYFSPLPKELFRDGGMIDVLYVDEFSLNFFTRKSELLRFQAKELPKNRRHPPGNEIYRCGNLSMFEVDGFEERHYCQNLCYIAKLFLDHKTLYFDVDPFLFYVLCEVDERGYHPVGYYSKEKYSDVGYNLACILTFPSHQRKGYGRFLIAFSYELSKKEEKVGSPEKPMSDLGQQAYIPYWCSIIVDFLLNESDDCKSMSIMDIAKKTSIMAEDIIYALNTLGILKFVNGAYFISAERKLLEDLEKKHPVKEPRVDPSKLHWTPYLTDVKRDKFSIASKKPSISEE